MTVTKSAIRIFNSVSQTLGTLTDEQQLLVCALMRRWLHNHNRQGVSFDYKELNWAILDTIEGVLSGMITQADLLPVRHACEPRRDWTARGWR